MRETVQLKNKTAIIPPRDMSLALTFTVSVY